LPIPLMTSTSSSLRLPPGPVEICRIDVDTDSLDVLQRLRSEYGNVLSIKLPHGRQACFVNDPDEVRRILVRQHSHYGKGQGFARVRMLLGNGIIVSDGDVWRRARTKIQPAFSRQNMHKLVALIARCCAATATRWADVAAAGGTLNMTREMNEFALELILRSVFGTDYDDRIVKDGENPFAFFSQDSARDLRVVLKVRKLRTFLLEIVTARRRDQKDRSFDLLSMYLSATDRSGQGFSDDELMDELLSLIIAGYETSAGTLNWAWWLIATHESVADLLLQEAQTLLADDEAISSESAGRMTYTQQVIDETLRLFPPVWLFSRRTLHNDSLSGFDLPADTEIFLSPYIMHRTAEFWPDAERFDPSRFSATAKSGKDDRAYFPFSLGPRRCLGEYFSFLEMKIHIAYLIQRFRFTVPPDTFPGLDLGINLRSENDIMLQPIVRRIAA